jgi:hypothetical protein
MDLNHKAPFLKGGFRKIVKNNYFLNTLSANACKTENTKTKEEYCSRHWDRRFSFGEKQFIGETGFKGKSLNVTRVLITKKLSKLTPGIKYSMANIIPFLIVQ